MSLIPMRQMVPGRMINIGKISDKCQVTTADSGESHQITEGMLILKDRDLQLVPGIFEISGSNLFDSQVQTFDDLKLDPLVLENVTKVGFKKPTPIQKNASPYIMAGRDIMACAQTGSGKT
ncbi:unnamed protein product, partial [Allacma fusca]